MAQSVLSAEHFQDEDAAFAYVEARLWPHGPICPHCKARGDKIGRLQGKTTRAGLRKCYACKKPFTVRIGTIFESSHLPLRYWLQIIHLMGASKKGLATRQIQRMLQCSMKTAWFLGHRIREAMAEKRDLFTPTMGGAGSTIEADETFIGRKPETKKVRSIFDMHAVVSLVERNGAARSFHVANIRANTLRAVLTVHASPASNLMTDDRAAYTNIGHNFASHHSVNHSAGEYGRGPIHTNTVEGFFSILKRGVYGMYQHVSEAHLKRYLAEFDFRYSNREKLGVNDTERAEIALQGVRGKRLTYQTTARGR